MIRTYGLTHVVLAVRDAARSYRFYHEVFGATEVWRDETRIDVQTPGSKDIIVFDQTGERAGDMGGIAHFGFRLVDPADLPAAIEAATRAGGTVLSRGEFCPGEPYAFVTDPDGYELEIWFEP